MAETIDSNSKMLKFVTTSATTVGPRVGRLTRSNRVPISTPHYISITSRGAIPHITQDIQATHTSIGGVYMAYEDFVERAPKETPPIFKTTLVDSEEKSCGRLRKFTTQPSSTLLILGLRRPSPLTSLLANTDEAVSICTSTGFRQESVSNYISSVNNLQPDVVIGPADIIFGDVKSSIRRIQKMTDRTSPWMEQIFSQLETKESEEKTTYPAVFAPILPVPFEQQRIYVSDLIGFISSNPSSSPSGLALYLASHALSIPKDLSHLPKLSLDAPSSPLDVLKQISLGIDILTIPFLNATTDAGIALDFEFPVPSTSGSSNINKDGDDSSNLKKPLGSDLWSTSHSTILLPLAENCTCYACTSHHRAYVHHLLSAKEMLGWTLLAIHNHHIMDKFFSGIRQVLSNENEASQWEEKVQKFDQYYEKDPPLGLMGRGPRVRGYQFKSGPSEPKRNVPPYKEITPKLEEEVKDMVMS